MALSRSHPVSGLHSNAASAGDSNEAPIAMRTSQPEDQEENPEAPRTTEVASAGARMVGVLQLRIFKQCICGPHGVEQRMLLLPAEQHQTIDKQLCSVFLTTFAPGPDG